MKKIKFLLLLSFLFFTFQVNAGYYYPYICDDYYCNSTYEGEISKNSNKYFLIPNLEEKITNKSLKVIIDEKLNQLVKYYGNTNFQINNIYDSNQDKLIDTDFDLKKLIEYNKEIIIGKKSWLGAINIEKKYDNGIDYLFSNFEEIINELHNSGFPYGEKNNSLKYFLENINFYSTSEKRFYVRNVCDSQECGNSTYYKIGYDNQTKYSFINGEVNPSRNFVLNTFVVSNDYKISSLFMKAGGEVEASFGFEDYLDISRNLTEYKYVISYSYDGGEIIDELTETIKISKDFKLYSDTIKPELLSQMFELKVLNSRSKHISLNIKEKFKRTKVGKITFYLSVQNLNTGDKFERKPINEIQKLNVLPVDKIGSYSSNIFGFTKENNENGYNVGDTFGISVSLKDIFGNVHYDEIDGYEVSFNSGTSDAFEISNQGSNRFYKSIFVKSNSNENKTLDFKIRLTKPGYHEFNGFNINFKTKRNNYSYTNPIINVKYEKIIPKELIFNSTVLKFYIKSPAQSDFPISCTNDKIVIETKCTSDNFSGCNSSQNKKLIFDKESDNGKSGVITIKDYAHNVKNFNYSINHIDKTAPTIQLSNGNKPLSTDYPVYSYSAFGHRTLKWHQDYFIANDLGLKINLYERTTSNCQIKQKISVKLNSVEILNTQITESSKEIILPDVFKKSGESRLYIKVEDNYGNSSFKQYVLNIVPAYPDITKSELVLLNPEIKYADNNEFYKYKLKLKDAFGNLINSKKIDNIEQNCEGYNGCKDLKTNSIDNVGENALITSGYDKTDDNGELEFNLKSLTPGEFSNRFKFSYKQWNEKNQEIPGIKTFFVSDNGLNKFKNIFYGELFVSRDGVDWGTKVEVGTKMQYKLEIIGFKPNYNFSTKVEDFKNKLEVTDIQNTYIDIDSVSSLDGLDTKKINFSLSVNNKSNSLGKPGIKIGNNGPEISYRLGGKDIKTNLVNLNNTFESILVKNESELLTDRFIGVRVIGNLQSSGNQDITGQQKNFSDISKSDLRTQIRKKSYEYVKNMKKNDIVGKVKYIENENIEISGDISDYETLVVKNGNVIITGNLNTSKNNFGIIVLKDGFDVKKDYENSGNVYIHKDVTKINALIYADGGVISSNGSNIYNEDTSIRTTDLQKQLFINGTLFTRNTIAGAIQVDGSYYLPGGGKTDDFNEAMIYDLNYLRRGNKDCAKNGSGNCIYSEATIIKYDSNNKPKLFSN